MVLFFFKPTKQSFQTIQDGKRLETMEQHKKWTENGMKGDARRQDRHHALQIDEKESVNMLHCIVNRLCMFTHPQDNTRLNKQQTKQETPPMKANSITTQDDIPTEPVCSTLQEVIDSREPNSNNNHQNETNQRKDKTKRQDSTHPTEMVFERMVQ